MDIKVFDPAELLGTLNDVEEKNAPDVLYVAGDEGILRSGARISVVGSRRATLEGLARARAYARELVDHNVAVVSGLAEGIDTAAQEEAIRAGGRTVAVLGSGLDVPFPAANRGLLERIIRDHVAVSQFPLGTPPKGRHFPRRNRVMALLTDATIIVDAGESSGTRHQGWEAHRLGRAVFLDRCVVDAGHTWAREMMEYGATIVEPGDIAPILDEIPQVSSGVGELAI